jgi:hypothetical protein
MQILNDIRSDKEKWLNISKNIKETIQIFHLYLQWNFLQLNRKYIAHFSIDPANSNMI